MRKKGTINSGVSAVVADVGHMGWLSIDDVGVSVLSGTKKIDLAVDKELSSFVDALSNALKETKVQKIYLTEEIKDQNPEQPENIKKTLPDAKVAFIPHNEFKKSLTKTRVLIRTGEMTPRSNVTFKSGVTL